MVDTTNRFKGNAKSAGVARSKLVCCVNMESSRAGWRNNQ